MSQTAARPWWAEVEHLRPDEDGGTAERPRAKRFERRGSHAGRPTAARPARPEPEVWLEDAEPTPPPKPQQRRTIEIRGQVDRVHGVAPVPSPGPQRIRGRRADERVGPRPDKIALWAVLLGLLLILVAVISSPSADAAALLAGWL
ncbi:MAG TPA: hypothetical protein VF549_09570 [Solirubrobacteraceae bacterium]|jgi:hypothetical protein